MEHYFTTRECVDCGCTLELGQFEYDQELCFRCLEERVSAIIANVNDFYPDLLWLNKEADKEILKFLMEVAAEKYGYFKIT